MKNIVKKLLLLPFAVCAFFMFAMTAMAADGDLISMTLKDLNNPAGTVGKIDSVDVVVAYANAGGGGAACTAIANGTSYPTTLTKWSGTGTGAVTVQAIDWVSGSAGVSCTFRVRFDDSDTDLAVDTSATALNVVYDGSTTDLRVTDGAEHTANVASIASGATELDGAAPAVKLFTYQDNDGDGKIDQFLVTFSETVTGTSVLKANDLYLSSVGDFTGAAFGPNTTDLITASVSSVTVVLGTEATAQDTNQSSQMQIASQNTFSLEDAGSNINSTITNLVQSISFVADGAKPVPTTATFYDATSNDGKLDIITVVWSENLSAVSNGTADWALSGSNFASIVEGSVVCNSGAAGTNECDYNFTTTTAKTDVGNLSLAYTAGTSVTDGTNTAVSVTITSATSPAFTDGAAPVVTAVDFDTRSLVIPDINTNGITITYSEVLRISTDGGGDQDISLGGSSSTTSTLGGMNSARTLDGIGTWNGTSDMVGALDAYNVAQLDATGKILMLWINYYSYSYFSSGSIAPTTPTFTPTSDANDITDLSENPVNASGTVTATNSSAWDVTKPTITSITLADAAGSNGRIDQATIVFNSSIKDASFRDANALLGGSGHTGTFSTGTANDATMVFNLTTDNLNVDTSATAAEFTHSALGSPFYITDHSGNLLDTTTDGTIVAADATEVDGAAPIYVSSTTVDNDNNGTVDYIKITYSEAILDSSVAAGDYQAGSADTTTTNLTEAFASTTPSSGNETNTANDAFIYVGVVSSIETLTAKKTDYTLKIQQTGAITDAALNSLASFAAQTSIDGAKPLIKTVTIEDTDGNGMIDKITFTWSENVDTDDGVAPVAGDMPTTLLPDGSTAVYTSATISDPAGTSAIVTVTGITGQALPETKGGVTAISGDLSAKWKDAATTTNAAHATGATGNESVTDSAKPALLEVILSKSFMNESIIDFIYSESLTVTGLVAGDTSASTSTLGNMTTAGTIAGIGSFSTTGSLVVPSTKNSVGLSEDGIVITVILGNQENGYVQSGATEAQVAGAFTAVASAVITDGTNQVNTSSNPTELYTTSWDYTRPTITSAVIQDNFQNSSLTGHPPFAAGADGQADTIVFTSSETLVARDYNPGDGEWSLTGIAGEYGTSLTPVYAARSTDNATTYELTFSGANIYYNLGTITVTYNPTVGSFQNSAHIALAPTSSTAKVCGSGQTCTAASGGVSYAVITNGVQTPSGQGDTTGPAVPARVSAAAGSSNINLTWTDPADRDLASVVILRAKNGQTVTGTPYATIRAGVQTYTDTDISAGDTVYYILKALDTSNNTSRLTDTVTVQVPAAETTTQTTVTPTVTTERTETPVVTEETPAVTEETPKVTEKTITSEEIAKEVKETERKITREAKETTKKALETVDRTVETRIAETKEPVPVIVKEPAPAVIPVVASMAEKPRELVSERTEEIARTEEIVPSETLPVEQLISTETGSYQIPVNLLTNVLTVNEKPSAFSESSLVSASTGDFSSLIEEVETLEYESLHAVPEVATEVTTETPETETPAAAEEKAEEKIEACSSKTLDSDSDGIFDAAERYIYGTNCMSADSDRDGRGDGQEIFMDMTSPVEANKIEKVNLGVSAFVKDSTFTSATPLITGTAETGTRVMVYVVDSKGRSTFYGYAIADKNNHYVVSGSTVLNDGSYKMYVIDESGGKSSETTLAIATKENKFKDVKFTAKEEPKSKSLFGKEDTKPAASSPVKVTNKGRAELSGGLSLPEEMKNEKKYVQLYAIWRSAVFTSTLLVDTSSGSFSIKSPEILEEGKHEVTLYLADKNVKSEVVRIPFDVTEEDLKAALATKTGNKAFYYGLIFVVLFVAGSTYMYRRKLA